MKLSPLHIYSSVFLPENLPDDVLYYYAKVLGKSELRAKSATFEQIIDWSMEAVEIPDKIEKWSIKDFSLFARFLNPDIMEWKKTQLITAWNFIREILASGLSFNNQIPYGYPTPAKPKMISPLLTYSICARIRPPIYMRGKKLEELYPVARAILFSGSIHGLVETFQQTISLSLLTTNDIEPIVTLMKQFDETTKIVAKNVKRKMNISDKFTFVRGRINDEIQERMDSGYFVLDGSIIVPDIESEEEIQEIRGVNSFSFYSEEQLEDQDFFHSNTSLPLITMAFIGNNLNDFEFGNFYAICLRNKQLPPNIEFGRENICAIIRAAHYHNRDITDAEFPENVLDEDMENFPYLNEDFNPKIPPKAYPLYILKELALNEGIVENLEENYDEYELHEMLQVNLLKPKFWLGLCTPTINKLTLYHEDIQNITIPISFGVKGESYYIFDMVELASYFDSVSILQNPASETVEYFSPTQMRQLLHLIEDNEEGSDFDILKKSIHRITAKLGSLEMKIQEFYSLYIQSSDEYKTMMKNLIIYIHEIGMSMRGWFPNKKLPIEEAVSNEYNKVEEQTNKSIGKFLTYIETVGKVNQEGERIKTCFLDIPIWKYRISEINNRVKRGFYLQPNHESNTIGKRIDLVLRGEQTGMDENSCIRLSSNYFCATSYRLAKIIDLNLGYDINQLREIS